MFSFKFRNLTGGQWDQIAVDDFDKGTTFVLAVGLHKHNKVNFVNLKI